MGGCVTSTLSSTDPSHERLSHVVKCKRHHLTCLFTIWQLKPPTQHLHQEPAPLGFLPVFHIFRAYSSDICISVGHTSHFKTSILQQTTNNLVTKYSELCRWCTFKTLALRSLVSAGLGLVTVFGYGHLGCIGEKGPEGPGCVTPHILCLTTQNHF